MRTSNISGKMIIYHFAIFTKPKWDFVAQILKYTWHRSGTSWRSSMADANGHLSSCGLPPAAGFGLACRRASAAGDGLHRRAAWARRSSTRLAWTSKAPRRLASTAGLRSCGRQLRLRGCLWRPCKLTTLLHINRRAQETRAEQQLLQERLVRGTRLGASESGP